jgi:hypothetical protein
MTRADVEETDAASAMAQAIAARVLLVRVRGMLLRTRRSLRLLGATTSRYGLFGDWRRSSNDRARKHRIESTKIL